MKNTVELDLTRGIKCSGFPSRDGGMAMLRNLKTLGPEGGYVQTPLWRQVGEISFKSYYDITANTAQNEIIYSSTTLPRIKYAGLIGSTYLFLSDLTGSTATGLEVNGGSYSSSAIPVIRRQDLPGTNSLTTQILFVPPDAAAAARFDLGGFLVVEITSTDHFRWSINGGAFSSSTAINMISGNALANGSGDIGTLYWLASTGFNTGDVFQWQRTDALHDSRTHLANNVTFNAVVSNSSLLFVDGSNRVCIYQNGFIRTVGYRPIYGLYLAVFANHLYVGKASETYLLENARQVSNSDINNFDNFFSTDTNEADQYTAPLGSTGSNYVTNEITGVSVLGDRLFVYFPQLSYYTLYLGLPIVNDYTEGPRRGPRLVPLSQQFVQTPNGDYIIDATSIWLFDGNTFKQVDADIRGWKYKVLVGWYDKVNFEVVFLITDLADFRGTVIPNVDTNGTLLCYQERFGTWYTRTVSFDNVVTGIGGLISLQAPSRAQLPLLSVANRMVLVEYTVGSLRADSGQGQMFGEPLAVFNEQSFDTETFFTEIDTVYVDADYGRSVDITNVPTRLHYAASNFAAFGTNATTPTQSVPLDRALVKDGHVNARASGRFFQFAVRFPVDTGSFQTDCRLSRVVPLVYNLQAKRPVK